MKITDQDYKHLTELINQFLSGKQEQDIKKLYQEKNLSMIRYRWDLYHAAVDYNKNHDFVNSLYNYLDDNNIDSALRKITNTK